MTLYPGTQTSHSFRANCTSYVYVGVCVPVCLSVYGWHPAHPACVSVYVFVIIGSLGGTRTQNNTQTERKTNRKNINNLFLLIFYWAMGCCHAYLARIRMCVCVCDCRLICVPFKGSQFQGFPFFFCSGPKWPLVQGHVIRSAPLETDWNCLFQGIRSRSIFVTRGQEFVRQLKTIHSFYGETLARIHFNFKPLQQLS